MKELFELSKESKELDKEIFNLNKFYFMAINSLGKIPNLYAYREFKNRAAEIIKKLEKVNAKKEFEKIFVENSLLNLDIQIDYLEFFTHGKKQNLENFSKKVLGENFFKIIKEKAENFDYKKFWEFYLSYQEYTYRQIPSDQESFRSKFEELLSKLKKDILEYAKENLGLKKDYDFEIILGPSFKDQTSFHPTNRRMEISPYSFFVYREENGKIKINIADTIGSIFHEIVGHGKQEANSRQMPQTMQDNSINTCIRQLHINFEGISQFAEEESLEFMKKFKEKYSIEEDHITQFKLGLQNRNTIAFNSLYSYFKFKKIENESFDINKEFEKIVKNPGLFINMSISDPSPLSFFSNSPYILGLELLKEILADLEKKLGKESYNKNFRIIDEAISTGIFHFKIWPKFIRFFLKEKGLLK